MLEKVGLRVSKNIQTIHIQKVQVRSTHNKLILILYIDIKKQQGNAGTENRTENGHWNGLYNYKIFVGQTNTSPSET